MKKLTLSVLFLLASSFLASAVFADNNTKKFSIYVVNDTPYEADFSSLENINIITYALPPHASIAKIGESDFHPDRMFMAMDITFFAPNVHEDVVVTYKILGNTNILSTQKSSIMSDGHMYSINASVYPDEVSDHSILIKIQ